MGSEAVITETFNLANYEKRVEKGEHGDLMSMQFQLLRRTVQGKCGTDFSNKAEYEANSEGAEAIESLAYQYMCNALFGDMGWSPQVGEVITPAAVMRRYNLRQEFKRLLITILRRLEERGILEKIDATSWLIKTTPPTPTEITETIKNIRTKLVHHPEFEQEAIFASYVGPYLYDILSGKENGLNILFPAEDSLNHNYAVKKFYEQSLLMRHYKLLPCIDAIVEQSQFLLNNGLNSIINPIRILEIGAGTGGTSIPLMRALTKLQIPVHYTFTDISNFFVGKAKANITSEFPTMSVEFKMLDIERPLVEQGIDIGSYDIVLAADVFHATEYLDDTLIHSRSALKDGGILVLGEVFQTSLLLEISFGLTGGWWRWGDEYRTHNSALLQPSDWDALLKQTGFAESFHVGHSYFGVVFARANESKN